MIIGHVDQRKLCVRNNVESSQRMRVSTTAGQR